MCCTSFNFAARTRIRCAIFCASFLALAAFDSVAVELDLSKLPPAASTKVDFVKDIQPILSQSCLGCHGPKKQEAELRWDAKEIALKGGEHGAVIVPGKSAESKMIQLVAGLDPENVMPKKGERLTAEQIGLLRAWIDQGANWPDSASIESRRQTRSLVIQSAGASAIPKVKNKKWVRNPIDNFVLARLEKEKLIAVAGSGSRHVDSPIESGFDRTAAEPSKRLTISSPTKAPMLTRKWWNVCSPRRITANDGDDIGWTWRVTRIPTVLKKICRASSGRIAIG